MKEGHHVFLLKISSLLIKWVFSCPFVERCLHKYMASKAKQSQLHHTANRWRQIQCVLIGGDLPNSSDSSCYWLYTIFSCKMEHRHWIILLFWFNDSKTTLTQTTKARHISLIIKRIREVCSWCFLPLVWRKKIRELYGLDCFNQWSLCLHTIYSVYIK